MAKNGSDDGQTWKDKVHEIVFTPALVSTCKDWVTTSDLDVPKAMERLVANGASIRVKFTESYDAYTFSITYPKSRTRMSGKTYWFWWGSLDAGIKVAAWLHEQYIEDHIPESGKLDRLTEF